MTDTQPSNLPELSVSDLSGAIRRTVEDAFGFVRVRGEVSGFRGQHSNGHAYFRLKDTNAVIDAVIWKGVYGRLRIKPEEGMEVVATGKVTTFAGKSSYQIVIESLEPAGVGALLLKLEETRKRLAAEGLFDAARKKPIPYLPRVIGVITSPTGAVIRDILHRLADRFPRQVYVWPVRVQGDGSAVEVVRAIEGFNALDGNGPVPRPDVLIVARGGGSLEDLWSFNEEAVVRAAAASRIPLIAAIGHETDTTLIDWAADRRAPTPTAAAEMAVPVRLDCLANLDDLARRNQGAMARHIERLGLAFRNTARALPDIEQFLAQRQQRLDIASERLPNALRANTQHHRARLAAHAGRLAPATLTLRLAHEGNRLQGVADRLPRAASVLVRHHRTRLAAVAARLPAAMQANRRLEQAELQRRLQQIGDRSRRLNAAFAALLAARRDRLQAMAKLLGALSYQGVLARGFALIRDGEGAPVRSAAMIRSGDRLAIEFADGRIAATAGDSGAKPAPVKPRQAPDKPPSGGQGSLF